MTMAFICIDTMALLALPAGQDKQGRVEFIAWVDTYLKGDSAQPYQYRGIDVYGARCAMLHAYGSEVDYHDKYQDAKIYAYYDGGKHAYDPTVNERLVIIGTPSFLNDVVLAVEAFLTACQTDKDLRARVEARLPKVLATYPL